MIKTVYCFIICLLISGMQACTSTNQSDGYIGRAVKIIDGDTFDLLMENNQKVRVRMHGIDCPERGMDFYKAAKEGLGNFCNNQGLKVVVRDKDQYGRTVADVYTADNKWINLEMVKAGLAWHYTHYDNDRRLDDAEQSARAARLGLWSLDNPTPPWEWRKEKRNEAVGK